MGSPIVQVEDPDLQLVGLRFERIISHSPADTITIHRSHQPASAQKRAYQAEDTRATVIEHPPKKFKSAADH